MVPTPTVAAIARERAPTAIYALLIFCKIDRADIFPIEPKNDLYTGDMTFSIMIIIKGVNKAKPVIMGIIPI
jgi:hypothetical protein